MAVVPCAAAREEHDDWGMSTATETAVFEDCNDCGDSAGTTPLGFPRLSSAATMNESWEPQWLTRRASESFEPWSRSRGGSGGKITMSDAFVPERRRLCVRGVPKKLSDAVLYCDS